MAHLNEQFITDASGNKTAVVVPYPEWLKILEMLEELDDIRAYDTAKESFDPIDWHQAVQDLENKKN